MSVPFRQKKSAAELVHALYGEGSHAPVSAMIEVADRCNETCVHCYQVQGQKGELPTDDWRRIMDELAEMGVVFLTLSGGEATLRRDFLELVEYAREKRFAVKLFTNGLSMTEGLARRLGELAVQEAQISLYSHRPDVHDAITCVPGSWERTVAGARHLIAAGVKVVLKSPLMRVNADMVDAYIAFVTSLGADYSLDPHVDPREDGDRAPEALRMDRARYLELRRDPRLAPPPRRPAESPLERSVCGACSGNIHIEANGEIRPCTQLTVPVGHAIRDGVRRAWAQDATGQRIRSVTWADLPGCRACDLRALCGRCFANARTEVGDALAPYPSACEAARAHYEVAHGSAPEIVGDASVGPYRDLGDHRFEAFSVELTADDREAAARHGWARPAGARPGLVQIRRPSRAEGGSSHGSTDFERTARGRATGPSPGR